MNPIAQDHFDRVSVTALSKDSLRTLADWITRNTFIGGEPYSYLDHEYQQVILSDQSQEVNVRKCSQVGVSEATARLSLAAARVMQPFTTIYTLPTAKFAATFAATRVDPVIDSSKSLREMLTSSNNEVKQIGDSFIYFKGAASTNAPISIPADLLIHDEYDFCDLEVLTQYTSRLTHSRHKLIRRFSTPTLPNYGVDKEFRQSRRHFNMCRCNHCNHYFVPDYYAHVKIPGYDGLLSDINKPMLARIRWREARLLCPKCGKVPSLQIQHRSYVCENPGEALVGAGYQVSPFDAPNIVTAADLVKASTDYKRTQDFVNFGLGLPMEDKEATFTVDDFDRVFTLVNEAGSYCRVMGIDVGATYHFLVGEVGIDGRIHIIHVERVAMGEARRRYHELRVRYRVLCTVIDSAPHAETVMALQNQDSNLFASVYVRNKTLLTHRVVDDDADRDEGKEFVRQVNVNRSRAFDAYMEFVRQGHLTIALQACQGEEGIDMQDLLIKHHMSQKRVRQYENESGELSYTWQKTDGEDHFHHAALYLYIASRIRGVSSPLEAPPLFEAMRLRRGSKI